MLVIVAACIWSVSNIQIKTMGEIDGMTLIALIGGGLLTVLGVGIITVRRPKLVAPAADRI